MMFDGVRILRGMATERFDYEDSDDRMDMTSPSLFCSRLTFLHSFDSNLFLLL